jgi:hypothetical protein
MRVRNLALVIVPAVAMGALALFLDGRVDARVAAGAIALALVPAPFLGPELVGRMRDGRMDQAGALLLGTAIAAVLVIGSRGSLASAALFGATEAFALTAMFAGALPTIRDRALLPLRLLGWIAFAATLISAAVALPPIDATTIAVSFALFVVGAGSAALVARAFDRDVPAAVAGAGLRDPALGVALAAIAAGPDAMGVGLVYAVFCLGLAALALRLR